MGPHWAPASVRIELGRKLSVINPVQGGGEDVPSRFKLIAPDEEPLVSVHRIQNEPLVSVWKLKLLVVIAVLQVELGSVEVHAQTRDLVADFEGDGLLWLNANHELVVPQAESDTQTRKKESETITARQVLSPSALAAQERDREREEVVGGSVLTSCPCRERQGWT